MQQFSVVLRELHKWFQSFKWYQVISRFELHLLFGGLAVLFLHSLLVAVLPISGYRTISFIFNTIPLVFLAGYAFWIGVWMTLVSANVKYLPYGLWLKALLFLFPFTHFSLALLLHALIYAALGYILFKYTASSYASISSSRDETHRF